VAKFPKEAADSLALLFTLCPDRFSAFPITDKDNYFVFGFEPWIVEVFFVAFPLEYEGGDLTGDHPLLQGKQYRYERAKKGAVRDQ
jgi:hypothetical protein